MYDIHDTILDYTEIKYSKEGYFVVQKKVMAFFQNLRPQI